MEIKLNRFVILFFIILVTSSFAQDSIGNEDYSFNRDVINLVMKDDGLDIPSKESGKTEYEIADMNHDGFLDIISVGDHGSPNVNSEQHGIMVWLGDGGNYWDVYQSGEFGYGGCAIGDLNLDGLNDVAWGVHHDYASGDFGDSLIEAALGDGTGSNWTPWGDGLATNGEDWGMFATDLADFDIDGDLDIISQSFGCCNGIQIYENLGNGSWSHVWEYDGGNVQYTLETGDFNADGFPDFICSHWDVNGFLGDGNFSFTNIDEGLPTGSINAVDVADMNHDGCDDIVVGLSDNQGLRCYVFDEQMEKWISYSTGLPTSQNYYLVQFGDIDGDENIDIVSYTDGIGRIYLGDGNGYWIGDASWTMPEPGDYSAMRVDGDVDFDGREDILIQASEYGYIFDRNCLRLYSPWVQPNDLSGYVKKPHGGETFYHGCIANIEWLSKIPLDEGATNVTILRSEQGTSGSWIPIVEDYPNSGSYQWIVQGNSSDNCRIKIVLNTETDTFSMISSNDFTIINDDISLSAYAGGPYYAESHDIISFTGDAFGGELPYTWSWDFGDGNTSTMQSPQHSYQQNGTYNVTLTVKDNQDMMDTDSTFALIQDITLPPTADFYYNPINPTNNDTISFIDNSTDVDGHITNWSWDFGDENYSYEQNSTHQYLNPGDYYVNLIVTDDEGLSDTICKQLLIIEENESIDVDQSVFDRGYRMMPGWDASQEFMPTLNMLSSVILYMSKFGVPTGNVTVQICQGSADGTVLTDTVLISDDVPGFPDYEWVTVDIDDISVTPGETYFIVLKDAIGADTHNCVQWGWCDSFPSGSGGPYDGGWFWFRKEFNPTWSPIRDWDYTFKTVGFL